ncbi:sensor histidine kinase [Paenibacillus sp. IB182496]|uniref:histidine kinase n=1 Tax=Paenibacillus sabuli TaxID=2772509 RepID=A0A927GUY0_9BACL|nr:histidine kinase [Paenibacillus sabuli]MBD2848177.1 sensor histidine kinase [Paenibacillus sabuli]
MDIAQIYRTYFKNNLFLKIILVFSVITVLTIITLSYLMYWNASQTAIRRELDKQRQAMGSVEQVLAQKYASVREMMNDVYRSDRLAAHLSYFLNHSYQAYVEYQLDQIAAEPEGEFGSVFQYFAGRIDADSAIRNIVLYSAEQQALYNLDEHKRFKLIPTNSARSYVPDVMAAETGSVAAPNYWVSRAIGREGARLYAVRIAVNDKQTLKNIGQLVVYFDALALDRRVSAYEGLLGEVYVRDANGWVLYDSTGERYGRRAETTEGEPAVLDGQQLVDGTYRNKLSSAEGGYAIIGEVTAAELEAVYRGTRNTIVLIALICIVVATLIPSLVIISLAKRTHTIIRFTRKVKNGDLAVRIDESREDELGQIAKSFNAMMEELNTYIDRVYKAEINQKRAELAALQARVNPHFLYNTLEVIRMRAFSKGDRDAAEMIYSLSALFKNLVHPKRRDTLQNELEACRLYLELFRIRYKDNFVYRIECPEPLGRVSVMRLTLQPIVENYIVHGIDATRADNTLVLAIRQDGDEDGERICATVRDNGKGMSEARLAQVRERLSRTKDDGESFGLKSVNERLQLEYGKRYGVEIESTPGEGTRVDIWLPKTSGEAEELV